MNIRIVALVALLLAPSRAMAEDLSSANHWVPLCPRFVVENNPAPIGPATAFFQSMCTGMMMGLLAASRQNPTLCVPPGVNNAQVGRVVLAYIEARPARTHEDFLALALEAMKTAWPCPKVK